MLKKIICTLLSAALLLSFSACSDIGDSGNLPSGTTVSQDSESDSATTASGSEDDSQPVTTVAGEDSEIAKNWSYEFDYQFIEENGIEYIWNQLDEDTKMNLGEVMNAIRNVQLYCPLTVGFPKEDGQKFLELVSNCTMFYSYASNNFRLHIDDSDTVKGVTISYLINYESEGFERNEALEAKLNEIVAGAPAGDEFERIKYLHDYLILNCDYSEDAVSPFSAYGSIVEGKATCQGYADGMHLLLDRAGYETAYAVGEGSEGVRHKWNYAKLSDGKWYIIDPTWDDPENKTEADYIGYDYFLISDEMILRDHHAKFDSDYYETPVAESMDKNYHKMMGYVATNADEAYDVLLAQAIETAKDGRRYLYLRFDDGEALAEAYEELSSGGAGNNRMQSIIEQANEAAGTNFSTTSWVKSLNEELGTLTITLKTAE